MKLPSILPLLACLLVAPHVLAQSTDVTRAPYIEITINGLEEAAPPLNRLADAVEQLSRSEKLSSEDQQKIVAIISELNTFSGTIDRSIQEARERISQTQAEIRDSLRQVIILAFIGLTLAIIIVGAALLYLFKLQVGPLINTAASTASKVATALEHLSGTADFIARQEQQKTRRFARNKHSSTRS